MPEKNEKAMNASVEEDNALVNSLLPTALKCVNLSQDLPVARTPAHIYYNDFPGYQKIVNANSTKLLKMMQTIADAFDGNGNLTNVPEVKTEKQRFDTLVDLNDRLTHKLSMSLSYLENSITNPEKAASENQLLIAKESYADSPIVEIANESNGNSSNSVKLLGVKNLARPQSMFKNQPDNSHVYFRPFLTVKPNCMVPLNNCLSTEDPKLVKEYPHPYTRELDHFNERLMKMKFDPIKNDKPKNLTETFFQYVDSIEELRKMLDYLSGQSEIAVDLEHHSYRTYFGITCLIQISSRERDYIIDAIALHDELQILNEVFTNPKITKVFHGSDLDLMWLQRDFSVFVVNLFDTRLAARDLQLSKRSLSFLLLKYVDFKANKQYQLADWRIRPLPPQLVDYARSDTHFLLYIAEVMRRELHDCNLVQHVMEGGVELCRMLYYKVDFNPSGYLGMYKNGANFSTRQLYALEHLYSLRDSIARQEDESVHYVLPHHMFKVLVENLPKEVSGILACCNPCPPLVRKYIHDIYKVIGDARNKLTSELESNMKTRSMSDSLLQDSEKQNPTQSGTPGPVTGSSGTTILASKMSFNPPHDLSHYSDEEYFEEMGEKQVSSRKKKLCSSPRIKKQSSKLCSAFNESKFRMKVFHPDVILINKILHLVSVAIADDLHPPEDTFVPVSRTVQSVENSNSLIMNEDIITLEGNPKPTKNKVEDVTTPMEVSTADECGSDGEVICTEDDMKEESPVDDEEVVILQDQKQRQRTSHGRSAKRVKMNTRKLHQDCPPKVTRKSKGCDEPPLGVVDARSSVSKILDYFAKPGEKKC